MRAEVRIKAFIEVKTEAEAQEAARQIDQLLALPAVKALLAGRGVTVTGHRVDPSPVIHK